MVICTHSRATYLLFLPSTAYLGRCTKPNMMRWTQLLAAVLSIVTVTRGLPMMDAAEAFNATNYHRVVIYMDYKISWNNLGGDIKDAADYGATHIILGFWLHDRVADAAQTWHQMSAADKADTLKYIHGKGAVLMVAAGGATEDIGGIIKNGPSGTTYGKDVAEWAKENDLDGIDFDLELPPGDNKDFKDGTFIKWAIDCSKEARAVLGSKAVISHAPQGPYLSPEWAGPDAGYVKIFKDSHGAIDYLFVQYYNQGAGVYDTYEQVFEKCGAAWADGSSVQAIVKSDIPSENIVVGKPVMSGMANNGLVPAEELAKWIQTARSKHHYAGGVGGWMWVTGNADVCKWINLMSTACGGKPTKTC